MKLFNQLYKFISLLTNRLNNQMGSPFTRIVIAILPLILFGIVSFFGISIQIQYDLLYTFSFTNIAIVAVSVLFIITISQYFLINDKVFLYYSWYLVLNICYFYYIFLGVEHVKMGMLAGFVHSFAGCMLIGGYFLYVKFTIYFLNLERDYPNFAKRLHFYSFLYVLLFIMDIAWQVYAYHDKVRLLVGSMIVIFCCIPIGIVSICECFLKLRGRLAYIFLAGSSFYFVGSVLGFLFASRLVINPFINPMMKNWTFFTEGGTILEVVLFSTGLAYRMRLIELEKQKIEKELLQQRVKELETEQALLLQRERISHDLHDDVGTTLNSISVFSALALQQISAVNPESIPILERIGDASRHLIEVMNDIVWVVNPQNDKFENVILRMRLFAAELLMPNNIQLHFNADEQLNQAHLSIEQRKHFYLIFKEAVNNVFKYAHCSQLNIDITISKSTIYLLIADNGQGFDALNPKNGNGLKNMQKRADILRGTIVIESQGNKGTTIKLNFPF